MSCVIGYSAPRGLVLVEVPFSEKQNASAEIFRGVRFAKPAIWNADPSVFVAAGRLLLTKSQSLTKRLGYTWLLLTE